ncbi:MAG: leucine dehydrogenase [Thermoleophilaceae bacterium]|jgi:leucine dehydrogenase|nr:leucine dehydrogenase [Thermoleophilaceae bacterium]
MASAQRAETPLVTLEHEELVVRRGRRTGAYTIVAVHSTALGPSLGGCRLWRYESSAAGARDALRLSRAMTFKAAAAGLSLGGGKGVICADPGPAPKGATRRALLHDFADTVNVLAGSYVTAEDVGTGARDMAVIAERTSHVSGLARSRGGSGNPSPFTARGVEAAMRACCEAEFGTRDLRDRTVSIVGAGHVGSELAKRLARAGAKLLLADIDPAKRDLAQSLGARWTDPSTALLADVDVVAPCALGGAIDEVNVGRLRACIVCGAANNQLAHDGLADDLASRGILYAPDYIVNAGGLINISVEFDERGYDAAEARRRVDGIEHTMNAIVAEATAAGSTPLTAADRLARRNLAAHDG